MKTLFKNCDIVTTTDSGFEVIRNGFCGVDGAYIRYLGTDKPDAASRYWQRLAAKGMAVR